MKTITAKEGMYLTQNYEVSIMERTFITEICGPDDLNENEWRDATKEELEEWEAEFEKLNPIEEEENLPDNDVE